MPLRVDDNKQIVVQMSRIGILGSPINLRSGTEYLPESRPEKMLAWNLGKGLHENLRLKIGHCAQLFGVVCACAIEVVHRVATSETISFAVIRFLSHRDSETNRISS